MSNETTPTVLSLGTHGVIRFVAAPRIELTPEPAPAFDKTEWKHELKGKARGLPDELGCTLEWKVVVGTDSRSLSHPRPTLLVKDGGAYKLVQKEGKKALEVNAFEFGLAGVGKLGYVLRPELLGAEAVECRADASGIEFDLPAALRVRRMPRGRGGAGGEAAGPAASTSGPASSEALPRLGAGAEVELVPEFGPDFKQSRMKVTLFEALVDADGAPVTRIEGTVQSGPLLEWTRTDEEPKAVRWLVGSRLVADCDAPAFCFGAEPSPDGRHHFFYEVEILPPAGATATQPIHVPPRPLCEMTRPGLGDFTLEWDAGANALRARGSFTGFDEGFSFPMEVETFTFVQAEPSSPVMRLHDFLISKCGEGVSEEGPAVVGELLVQNGQFCGTLLTLDRLTTEQALVQFERRVVFAELRFPAARFSRHDRQLPFIEVATYTPATPDSGPGSGALVPSFHGSYAPWYQAPGVSSNWVDATASGRIPVREFEVPPERVEEFKWFLACVCGEAYGRSERAQRGVAQVIVNRVGHKDFGSLPDTKKVVQSPKQFSCYRDKEGRSSVNFQKGIAYSDAAQRATLSDADQKLIADIRKAIVPVFLGIANDGVLATFFFSPAAQAALGGQEPEFAAKGKHEEVTARVLGSGSREDFRFFRLWSDASRAK